MIYTTNIIKRVKTCHNPLKTKIKTWDIFANILELLFLYMLKGIKSLKKVSYICKLFVYYLKNSIILYIQNKSKQGVEET